jgi:hypothetical protein
MAVKGNLVIDQGTDYEVTVDVRNINNGIANLTGYTSYAQMRKHYTSSKYYEFDTSVEAANGTVILSMTAEQTNIIPHGRYVYDCEVVSPDGVRTRLVEGIVTVTPQATRNE